MNHSHEKRLSKLARKLEAMPLPPAVIDDAFARFRKTGQLPDDPRLARAAVERALQGPSMAGVNMQDDIEAYVKEVEAALSPPLRHMLFEESIHQSACVREPARAAIRMLVSGGQDVTDTAFVPHDVELPESGSVGLHLLGWPEILIKKPHVRQARRLLLRLSILRECIPHDDDAWFESLATATRDFLHTGVLPDDALLQDAVLAYAELIGLMKHFCDAGDGEVMTAFDAASRGTGNGREDAIEELQTLARAGRLVSAVP